jgi:hypothetical protein
MYYNSLKKVTGIYSTVGFKDTENVNSRRREKTRPYYPTDSPSKESVSHPRG